MTNTEINEADKKKIREVIKQLKKAKIVGEGPTLYYDPEDDTCKQIPK